jgi:hypothetical protein
VPHTEISSTLIFWHPFCQKTGKGKDDSSKNKDDSWQTKATSCHQHGKIGHIRPNCPILKDDENKETDMDRSDSPPKSSIKDSESVDPKKKKETSFA